MRFVSLFAGVGGFDLGLEQGGHTCVGQVELDDKARSVLTKHWPDVPKHDDVVTAKEWADAAGLVGNVDLVCGGFPCQDLSIAGKRAGLAGERSGLFFDALAFATHVKAPRILLENVVGLLSSNQGRDFGIILVELADAGYRNIEWRVLDSQFFGVPQRRRRVFLVASAGDLGLGPVLTEREGGGGDPAEVGAEREEASRASSGRAGERVEVGVGNFELWDFPDRTIAPTLNAQRARDCLVFSKSRRAHNPTDFETWVESGVSPTLNVFDNKDDSRATVLVRHPTGSIGTISTAFGDKNYSNHQELREGSVVVYDDLTDEIVRRLTPTECERLQGFPDGWTAGQADSNRYKQMGNAVTVNVIKWIGDRL